MIWFNRNRILVSWQWTLNIFQDRWETGRSLFTEWWCRTNSTHNTKSLHHDISTCNKSHENLLCNDVVTAPYVSFRTQKYISVKLEHYYLVFLLVNIDTAVIIWLWMRHRTIHSGWIISNEKNRSENECILFQMAERCIYISSGILKNRARVERPSAMYLGSCSVLRANFVELFVDLTVFC